MKNFYLFLLCLCTFSCVMDSGENVEGKRTRAAHGVFEYTARYINSQMNVFYLAKHLDMYINATTDEEKYWIEDLYFKNQKIRKIDGGYTIYDTYSTRNVITEGQKFSDIGASWKLSGALNIDGKYSYGRYVECVIVCNANSKWQMKYEASRNKDAESSLCSYELHEEDDKLYIISGDGECMENKSIVEYKIMEPVRFNINHDPLLSQGKIEMTLTNSSYPEGEMILVDLSMTGRTKITYRGITEIW